MPGFFKKIVDRVSGYSDEYEDEYEDDQYDERQDSHSQSGSNEFSSYYDDQTYVQQPQERSRPQQSPPQPQYTARQDNYRQEQQYSYSDQYRADIPSSPPPMSSAQSAAPISSKVVPLKGLSDRQLVFLQPDSIKSAQLVCDHLRNGHAVICNIENVDAKIAQRVIDFISGSAFALDGKVKPIDSKAHNFVAAPKGVSLVDDKQDVEKRNSGQMQDQGPYRQQYM